MMMMATEKLPYQAVEYLESTGSQYIQTSLGFTPGRYVSSYDLKIRARFTDIPSSDQYACGLRTSDEVLCVGLHSDASYGLFIYAGAASEDNYLKLIDDTNKLGWHTFEVVFDGTSKKFYVDGVLYKTTADTLARLRGFILFGTMNNQSVVSNKAHMQIASASLVTEGVKMFDYVSVRDGQVGYMYDKVSKQLASKNGTFIVGPDI